MILGYQIFVWLVMGSFGQRNDVFSKNLKMKTEMISRNVSDKNFDKIKLIEFAILTVMGPVDANWVKLGFQVKFDWKLKLVMNGSVRKTIKKYSKV